MGSRPLSTVTLTIFRVTESKTRTPGVRAFLIEGDTPQGRLVQVQTIDPWRATLCDRARQTHQPITVQYEETRYGKTIRKVSFNEPTDWSAA